MQIRPDKAQEYLDMLIEEFEPEMKKLKEEREVKQIKALQEEQHKVYGITIRDPKDMPRRNGFVRRRRKGKA